MNGPGSAARGARDPRRARSATPDLAAAAVATVLLLTTQVGRVASDTKTYLFIDPGRFLRHAAFLWDPGVGLGTVTHQHIGYLWPAGPLIWLTTAVGLPTWAAQRLWLAGLLTASFVGVRGSRSCCVPSPRCRGSSASRCAAPPERAPAGRETLRSSR